MAVVQRMMAASPRMSGILEMAHRYRTKTNPAHTYTAPGNYTTTLTVTDNTGQTNTDTVDITVGGTSVIGDWWDNNWVIESPLR